MSTDTKTRRTIAQRVIERAAARGAPIDTDPAFLAVVEEWICGDIDMRAMRERYLDTIALRADERRGPLRNHLGINPSKPSDHER